MKWINGLTQSAKEKRRKKYKEQWHKWFAWYPIVIGYKNINTINERKIKVWLQTIERKVIYCVGWDNAWYYDYREVK